MSTATPGEMIDEGYTPTLSEETLAERKLQADLEEQRGEQERDSLVPQERARDPLRPSLAEPVAVEEEPPASKAMTRAELNEMAPEFGLDASAYSHKTELVAAINAVALAAAQVPASSEGDEGAQPSADDLGDGHGENADGGS